MVGRTAAGFEPGGHSRADCDRDFHARGAAIVGERAEETQKEVGRARDGGVPASFETMTLHGCRALLRRLGTASDRVGADAASDRGERRWVG